MKRKKILSKVPDCQNCHNLLVCLPLGNNETFKENCIFREEKI